MTAVVFSSSLSPMEGSVKDTAGGGGDWKGTGKPGTQCSASHCHPQGQEPGTVAVHL